MPQVQSVAPTRDQQEQEVQEQIAKLPDRLRRIRGARSRRAFARDIGAFQDTVRRYEEGRNFPSAEFLIRLAVYEDIPPDWILLGE